MLFLGNTTLREGTLYVHRVTGLPLVLKFLKKFTLSLKVLKSNILPLNSLRTITFKTRLE